MTTVSELIRDLQTVPNPTATAVDIQTRQFSGVLTAATGSLAATAHGLAVGDRVFLRSVTTTTGPIAAAAGTTVYVKTVTDANNFITSATPGGAALTGTTDGTYTANPADASVDQSGAVSAGIESTDAGVVQLGL